VVYLQVDEKKGIYEGRDVTLGPRVGGYYVVRDGLAEGDVLVTQGAFKIDSAIQIQAGPSMMNPEEVVVDEVVVFADVAQAFRMQLAGLFGPYLSMQEALGGDALQPAHEAAQELQAALKQVDMSLLKGRAHTSWMALSASLTHGGEACAASKTLAEARVAFETLSIAMISLQKQFDPMLTVSLYEARCPMAFDYKGASWFQSSTNIFNPYFGAEMLECGVIDARYPAAPSELPHDHSEQ
jgi:Cu(I)/Ag(I) efflux system membrane fusion protein